MKTYTVIDGCRSLLSIDKESEKVNIKSQPNEYLDIDWAWVIEEDGEVFYKDESKLIKSGDILIKTYNAGFFVITSPEWVAFIKQEKEKDQLKEDCGDCAKMASEPLATAESLG